SSNTNAQTKEAKASKSSSSILTKKYDLSEVQKFDIHKMVDVEVIYGAENSVSVIGDANSQDLVAVENNQGTVTIYSKPSKNGKPGKYKVVIQTTQVDQFNVEKVSNFKMNISAANKKISIALKSVSRANIKANAQQLDLQANSCSTIILSGDAKVANYKLQSISTFNSKKLMA